MILFVVWGTGGAEVINEVIKDLKQPYKVLVCTDFARSKINNTDKCERMTEDEVSRYIQKERPKVVINERSNGIPFQNGITNLCKVLRIPNIVVLDVHYITNTELLGTDSKTPDYITVVSESSKEKLKELGVKKEKIIEMGNPSFTRLQNIDYTAKFPKDPRIIYTSQGGKGNIPHKEQIRILEAMYNRASKSLGKKDLRVDIKLHPMEEEYRAEWERDIEGYKKVRVLEVDASVDFLVEGIPKYDLVWGLSSTLQIQSYLKGIPTIFFEEEDQGEYERYKAKQVPLQQHEDILGYYDYSQGNMHQLIESVYNIEKIKLGCKTYQERFIEW